MRRSALEATAYHEAGHIVMAWHVGESPMGASIGEPRLGAAGVTNYEQPMAIVGNLDPNSDRARLAAERGILVSLAGPLAQRRYRPASVRRAHSALDIRRSAALATAITDSHRQSLALLKFLTIRAEDILAARWDKVSRIAQRLIGQRALSRNEIIAILGS